MTDAREAIQLCKLDKDVSSEIQAITSSLEESETDSFDCYRLSSIFESLDSTMKLKLVRYYLMDQADDLIKKYNKLCLGIGYCNAEINFQL